MPNATELKITGNPSPQAKQVLRKIHAEFSPSDVVPKYHQLFTIMRRNIMDGTLRADDQLPTSGSIASLLRINRITVDRAIQKLVDDNLVERIQGKGTFVRMTTPKINSREIVGVIARTHGHIWDDFIRVLVRGLARHDLYCMMTDFSLVQGDIPPTQELLRKLKKVIDSEPAHLVIDGVSRFPFELLNTFKGQLIFIHCFECDVDFEANYLLSDSQEGGRLVGDHLLSLGHSKIAFIVPKMEPRHKMNLAIFAGLKGAFHEKSISEDNIQLVGVEDEDKEFLRELLKSSDRPTAVFSHSDHRAMMVYEVASQLGLRIPEDLAVVGFYNTPWCHKVRPNLTSVCINEKKIAQAVLSVLESGEKLSTIMVQPTLNVRESCGGKPQNQ